MGHIIERLHEEFKRRIKTQTVLPSADTAAMLFWALLAIAFVVLALRHWVGGRRVKVKRRSPASSRLSATGAMTQPPLADEGVAALP